MTITLKAIFVDFDGTLVDSLPALWKCYRLFLSHHGIKGENEEFTSLMGPPISGIVSQLKEKYHLEEPLKDLIDEYEQIVASAYSTQTVLFPWAIEILQKQKDRGVGLAIVTSAYPSFVQQILRGHHVEELFDAICGHEYGEPPKPHPAVYQRALKIMEVDPREVIAIEDAQSGIISACKAGIATIAFDPEIASSSSLTENGGAFYLAKCWQDIGELLWRRDKLPLH